MGLYIIDPYPGGQPAVTDFELGGISQLSNTAQWPQAPLGPFFLPPTLPPSYPEVGGKRLRLSAAKWLLAPGRIPISH